MLKFSIATGLMRDPCVLRGPDGQFHVVWTTGWWDRVIGFNVIDATIVEDQSASRGDAGSRRFVMVLKDETKNPVAKKHLRVATAATLQGPYGAASAPITVDWVEGPTLLRAGPHWMLYYDEYTRKRYGASRSTDLKTWTVVPESEGPRFPAGARHGTAFSAPAYLVEALEARIKTK